MKKVLFGALFASMLAMNASVFALGAFANFFSISTQPLSANDNGSDAARFDLFNSKSNIDLSQDKKTITLTKSGQYAITFVATGGLSSGGTQQSGPWSIGLYRNGGLIIGSVAAAHSGTDGADTLTALTTTGQVIISASAGDTLQVRNVTDSPIALLATVDGSNEDNSSISINIIEVE